MKRYIKKMIWRVRSKWWTLKGHVKGQLYRYRTVKPRTLKGNLWIDRDALLYHCMFEILSQFIEKELSPMTKEDVDSCNEEHKDMLKEQYDSEQGLISLYNWWHKEYIPKYEEGWPWNLTKDEVMEHIKNHPKVETKFKGMPSGYICTILEDELHDELLQKCKRLVDLSPNLWT